VSVGSTELTRNTKPKLAVWKFASCDGCQLTLLDLEDHLLAIADTVELADFREATSRYVEGPFDLSLVEGSITTPHDAERIQEVRAASGALVTIGACATAGGVQALRNFADVRVHRVQGARERVHHGGARDAVPRPGDARRLRGSLPRVQPGLLRLLRAEGDAEHGRARAAAAAAGALGARRGARLLDVQRRDRPLHEGGRP
jgi:hypothetical protein